MPDLVAAGDYLVTSPFGGGKPLVDDVRFLRAAVGPYRRVGAARLSNALAVIREGPLSRTESLTRVMVVTAGFPEPVANLRLSPLMMFDLAWPQWRVAIDYQGDHHRSPSQYARDLGRIDVAREQGWDLMQIGKRDLFEYPFDFLGRLRTRLVGRGASIHAVHPSKVALARP